MSLKLEVLATVGIAAGAGALGVQANQADAYLHTPPKIEQYSPQNIRSGPQLLPGTLALMLHKRPLSHGKPPYEFHPVNHSAIEQPKPKTNIIELCNEVEFDPGTNPGNAGDQLFKFRIRAKEPNRRVAVRERRLLGVNECESAGVYPEGSRVYISLDQASEPDDYLLTSKSMQATKLSKAMLKFKFEGKEEVPTPLIPDISSTSFGFPGPMPKAGDLVFCTDAYLHGCAGTWLEEDGTDSSINASAAFQVKDVATGQIDPNILYVDDDSYCTDATAQYVPEAQTGSPECEEEWVSYYHERYPKDVIYSGVNPRSSESQRYAGSISLYEDYDGIFGLTIDKSDCFFQGAIFPLYLEGVSESDAPIFQNQPSDEDINKLKELWESAVECTGDAPNLVLGWY